MQFLSLSCRHNKTTQPFTASEVIPRSDNWDPVGSGTSHYVVCLDCGRKIAYDWANMRMVR
jgi:hypothetical protein